MSDVNFVSDERLEKIREELVSKLIDYRQTIHYMITDAPISVLCLPSKTQKALRDHGCLRIYDLFDLDFAKVEGISDVLSRDLTSRLNQFLSVL